MTKRGKDPALVAGEDPALVSGKEVVDPLLDAPAEVKPQPEPAPVPTRPTLGQRLGRFFRFLLRLVLVLILLAAIAAALYFGLPLLYQRYVVPVEQNTSNLAELESRQDRTEQQLSDLQTKLETIESVQNQHDQLLTELNQHTENLESEIAARTESLAALEKMQAELQIENESVSAELERQITLLKSMELLSRARLFLYESNFGLARQDVQIARDLLDGIEPDANSKLANELGEVIFRLDMTLSKLPDFPVAASDDLDIAWQILLSGLPAATPTITVTPTQVGTASPTPSAANMTTTPTPRGTVLPSPTP